MTQRPPPEKAWLRVGEVARRTGLTVRTLHHYDQLGLLVPSGRSDGDYRLYDADDLRRLLAIQHLKSLGLSLDDIAAALDDPTFDARDAVERHIALVEERLGQERELLARLRGLREASETGWEEVLDVIALTERLRHPDPVVRVRAALDAPTTAPLATLVELLVAEPDVSVRETLTWAIAGHGRRATPLLVRQLASKDARVRLTALHVLSKVGDPAATAAVAERLGDADGAVARKAAFTLGQIGGGAALAALVAALGVGDTGLGDAVATALARFGASASGPLIDALGSPDAAVRGNAAESLALIGDPAGAAQLAATLDDPDPTVRFAALFALGELPGETAGNAIAGAVESDDARVRALATRLRADRAGGAPRG